MSEIELEMDAIQYVKLEALASRVGLSPEDYFGIFLDARVGLTRAAGGGYHPNGSVADSKAA